MLKKYRNIIIQLAIPAMLFLVHCGNEEDINEDDTTTLQARALIVPINVDQSNGNTDLIAVFSLKPDGTIVDNNIRLISQPGPKHVAIRDDGNEALITYTGDGINSDMGVMVLNIEPDGSSAEIIQNLVLSQDFAPGDVSYMSDTEAVITNRGPGDDNLQAITKNSNGVWVAGPAQACGEGPLLVHGLHKNGTGLLVRTDFLGTGNSINPITKNQSDAWEIQSSDISVETLPIDIHVNLEKDLAYISDYDPESSGLLNPQGLVYIIDISSTPWSFVGEPVSINNGGSLFALSADGSTIVISDAVVGQDPYTGQYYTEYYQLLTLQVDEDGIPSYADVEMNQINAYLISDLAFTPHDQLLLAVEIFKTEASYEIQVYKQDQQNTWQKISNRLLLPGSPSTLEIYSH